MLVGGTSRTLIETHSPVGSCVHAGKVDADMRSEMRTNMDVDAGEEQRDDGLRVQVRTCCVCTCMCGFCVCMCVCMCGFCMCVYVWVLCLCMCGFCVCVCVGFVCVCVCMCGFCMCVCM